MVHTEQAALRYLMARKKVEPRLIQWILLPQEFDFEVKDIKDCEKQADDHLSRLESNIVDDGGIKIDDSFSNKTLMAISQIRP